MDPSTRTLLTCCCTAYATASDGKSWDLRTRAANPRSAASTAAPDASTLCGVPMTDSGPKWQWRSIAPPSATLPIQTLPRRDVDAKHHRATAILRSRARAGTARALVDGTRRASRHRGAVSHRSIRLGPPGGVLEVSGARRGRLGDALRPGLDRLVGGFEGSLGLAQCLAGQRDEQAAESFGLTECRGVLARRREFEAVVHVEQPGCEDSALPCQDSTRFGSDDRR